jgi:hypothetical protein
MTIINIPEGNTQAQNVKHVAPIFIAPFNSGIHIKISRCWLESLYISKE